MQQQPSYVHGAHHVPLTGETIGAYLDDIALRHAEQRCAGRRRTRTCAGPTASSSERVNRLAAGLLELGLAPGDRIGIWSQNCAEWVLTQFATAKAGLVMVNINPAYRRAELEYVLDKVQCSALILAPSFKTQRLHRHAAATWCRNWRTANPASCMRRACRSCGT